MGEKAQNKSGLACQYREKFGFEMPTKKLARIMYADHPLMFTDVEDARRVLRYIEGKNGARDRKKAERNYAGFVMDKERPKNPYNLPESYETTYDPYIIEGRRVLVLSDIHIPYHSIRALTAALEWGEQRKPDTILLNGDTLDAHQLSRFVRDPNKRSFAQELDAFREFFGVLNDYFDAKIIFKVGNHEERYEHFLMQKAGELNGVEEFLLENIIRKRAPGVEVVGEKRIIKAGGLNIIHGHEFGTGFFSPVNVARGLFLRAKVSALQGHNHQTSEHTETDMNGKTTTTWSTGCLSEKHPAYLPINKWNHGFAWVDIDGDEFEVENKRIINGKVY